ncbi:RNA polymerase Rpb7 [Aspergillus navahoensis]
MFFLKEETKVITLHPSYFGPNVREYLINRLNEEEEGRCTGDHFVICVMDMVDIGEGRVLPGNGQAEYTIKYRAIIWKPFRGETVDALVTSVKPTGIFTLAGPLSVFIARKVCCSWLLSRLLSCKMLIDPQEYPLRHQVGAQYGPTTIHRPRGPGH